MHILDKNLFHTIEFGGKIILAKEKLISLSLSRLNKKLVSTLNTSLISGMVSCDRGQPFCSLSGSKILGHLVLKLL